MRYIIFILLTFSALTSNEFPYIQPVSVEKLSQNIPTTNINTQEKNIQNELKETKSKTAKISTKKMDADKDGVSDKNDKCPNTSNKFIVDNNGCPTTSTLNIKFDTQEFTLTDKIFDDLENFADFLKINQNYQVFIYGYTDNIGNKKYNKNLSQQRANSVKEGLILHGISPTKLTAIGRGIENPIADNSTSSGREKNRRIEVDLIQ